MRIPLEVDREELAKAAAGEPFAGAVVMTPELSRLLRGPTDLSVGFMLDEEGKKMVETCLFEIYELTPCYKP